MVRHKNDERIRRPVVWVVGASRGIGREIAKQFAFIGCVVCLSSRNARGLRTAAREIAAAGGRAYAFPCDIRRNASVFAIAKEIRKKIGEIEVLVNSAGITVFKSFLDTSLPE